MEQTNSNGYDFCESEDAIFLNNSKTTNWYNTKSGSALILIPVPKGSKLIKVIRNNKLNLIEYVYACYEYSKNYVIRPKFINNLSKKSGAELSINVSFIYAEDKCKNSKSLVASVGKKDKKSTIKGQP